MSHFITFGAFRCNDHYYYCHVIVLPNHFPFATLSVHVDDVFITFSDSPGRCNALQLLQHYLAYLNLLLLVVRLVLMYQVQLELHI